MDLTAYEVENGRFPHGFDDDTKGWTIPPGGYVGNGAYDRMGWWWFQSIAESLGHDVEDNSVLRCPSGWADDPSALGNVLVGNYGVNQAICKNARAVRNIDYAGRPLNTSHISSPAETLLVVDSGYSTMTWWHATEEPPVVLGYTGEDTAYVPGLVINRFRILRPGTEMDAQNGRHVNRTVNVGFVDGHVKSMRADKLHVKKQENTDDYANRFPLWLP